MGVMGAGAFQGVVVMRTHLRTLRDPRPRTPLSKSPFIRFRKHPHCRSAILACAAARVRSAQTLSAWRMSRKEHSSSAVSAMRAAAEWEAPARGGAGKGDAIQAALWC